MIRDSFCTSVSIKQLINVINYVNEKACFLYIAEIFNVDVQRTSLMHTRLYFITKITSQSSIRSGRKRKAKGENNGLISSRTSGL